MREQMILRLKARQLGVSWLGIGYCEWKCLTSPGTRALCDLDGETESAKLIGRAWDLWENSPEHLRFDARSSSPRRGDPRPGSSGLPRRQISSLLAMPSSPRAGHGETAGVVFLDEFGRHPYAGESWKAFLPVDRGRRADASIVSTANGFGNEFYELWTNAEDRGITAKFLGADLHPGRDVNWFAQIRQRSLDGGHVGAVPAERRRSVPGNVRLLVRHRRARPLRGEGASIPSTASTSWCRRTGPRRRWRAKSEGLIRVWAEPEKGKEYALYADVATGRGKDYTGRDRHRPHEHEHRRRASREDRPRPRSRSRSTSSGAGTTPPGSRSRWVAASESRSSSPCATASSGRRPYPKLYRHVQDDRPDYKQNITYGFPITTKTRPLIINALEVAIREEALPHMPMDDDLGVQDLRAPRHVALPASGRRDATTTA